MFIIDVILAASLTVSGCDAVFIDEYQFRPETAIVIGDVTGQGIWSDARIDGRVSFLSRVPTDKGHAIRAFRLARDCCGR